MTIHHMLRERAFDPELVKVMTNVFEDTIRDLRLANRDDQITKFVARIIVDCAERGIRDPIAIQRCVREELKS